MSQGRWLIDGERHVRYRADFLERITILDDKRTRLLSLRELGYSQSGIAKKVDQTESMVTGYLEEIAVQFGQAGVETHHPDEIAADTHLEPVTPKDIIDLPDKTREWWIDLAEKHADLAPDWFDYTEALGG